MILIPGTLDPGAPVDLGECVLIFAPSRRRDHEDTFTVHRQGKPSLVEAMFADAFKSPYVCVDATGVLVQAKEQCQRAHFWVLVAPERHVLYRYSARHDSKAVDHLLAGYQGYLVADAHVVYDHLFKSGDVVEVAC